MLVGVRMHTPACIQYESTVVVSGMDTTSVGEYELVLKSLLQHAVCILLIASSV